ncbi:LacI family DNA-binding transcriptional regulator [Metabacillus sp. Hm71]|uniref:LacI family DNA-binding transcriptional regulator n=1 Tax=Metabacillus sp. Hm71 TaxID=3450743 RepID=UPI003F42178E
MAITMADVAKRAGVSKSTVSQFLNKRYEYMSEETRYKIRDAIKELGYQPNYVARSLKQKRTSMIGIIVANIMHRFSTEVCRALEDYFNNYDMNAIICNADNDPEKERKYIEMLRAKQVDGLIIFPTGQNIELYQEMINAAYPVVFMDRKVKDLIVPTVVVNNKEATKHAVEHLIKKQYTKIAIATEELTISTRHERKQGYMEALKNNNMPVLEEYMISTPIHLMAEELEKLFSLEEPPTALVAANDLVFLEVLKFAKENDIKIGKQLGLIVFDNIPFANLVSPTVTTISQPAYDMGKKAAELLLKLINKEEVTYKNTVYSCELYVRESTKGPGNFL